MFAYFSFIFIMAISLLIMWIIFKFMYPKPPPAFMPKKGDVIRPRDCSLCGYPLAEYRGVMESKPEKLLTEQELTELSKLRDEQARLERDILGVDDLLNNDDEVKKMSRKQKKQIVQTYNENQDKLFEVKQSIKKITTWFFCNYDHQNEYHEQHRTMV